MCNSGQPLRDLTRHNETGSVSGCLAKTSPYTRKWDKGTVAVHREFRVLVATDGSAAAKAAVATAARFPWPARTRALGVTARQVPRNYRLSILLTALDRSAEVVAAGARRALSRRWPETDVTIVDTAPIAAVLNAAKRFEADAIVLGWRGHGSVRRILIGSVSRGVVRGATCAVLVVRRPQLNVHRIVIGFDGSANAAGSRLRAQAAPTSRWSSYSFHVGRSHGRAIACPGIGWSKRDGRGGGQAHQR